MAVSDSRLQVRCTGLLAIEVSVAVEIQCVCSSSQTDSGCQRPDPTSAFCFPMCANLGSSVANVTGIPHQCVAVHCWIQRRKNVPGLTRQNRQGAPAEMKVCLTDTNDLTRFASTIFKIRLEFTLQFRTTQSIDSRPAEIHA